MRRREESSLTSDIRFICGRDKEVSPVDRWSMQVVSNRHLLSSCLKTPEFLAFVCSGSVLWIQQ